MALVAYWPESPARGFAWAATLIAALVLAAGEAQPAERRAPLDVAASGRGFTINEVLASRDSGRPGAADTVVAVEKSDALRDLAPRGRATGPEPFGLYAMRAPDGQLWIKWRTMEKDLVEEATAIGACVSDPKNCANGAKRYLLILDETKKREGRARLETANRLLNRAIRYAGDMQQHGVADRWTAPLASLTAERGDCEDFAIAKYAVLRAAGIAESDMRLVLVRDTEVRVDHAVLAVRFEGRWLVLDNRRGMTVETAELRHYMPLFALDRDGVKFFAPQFAARGDKESASAELWGGDEASAFSTWTLRGSDFAAWELRGSEPSDWSLAYDLEPAAAKAE
jgi:predicted transglutaminase-like cysteine proteinase